MSNSRIPSPARSQGPPVTPRRYKTRTTRSVGSPARSTASGRLSNIVDQFKESNKDSFAVSPLSKTVLSDNTEIEMPRRKSWWRKVENSRDVIEVLENEKPVNAVDVLEEFEMEVLTQEKKNYTIDLPESSDNESINSIVVPQRKLFIQKENLPQKQFGEIVGTSKKDKTRIEDKTIHVGTKNLFGKAPQRTKPIFPSALLNMSNDKTLADKTKEIPVEVKAQAKGLFGRPGAKRKNMFADFIVSESEDEIPEIQPKRFTFHKQSEPMRRSSNASSITTDIELDDWKLLPSSTMVEHQLEAQLTTPGKKARLSKLSEAKESINTDSKHSNKSMSSKNKSKSLSPARNQEAEQSDLNKQKSPTKDVIAEATSNQNQHADQNKSKTLLNKSKNLSQTQDVPANEDAKETSNVKNKTYNINKTNPLSKSQTVENNQEKDLHVQQEDKNTETGDDIAETEPAVDQQEDEEIALTYEDNDPEDIQEDNDEAKRVINDKTKTICVDNRLSKVSEYMDNIEKELSRIIGAEDNHILQMETPMPNKSAHLTNRFVGETPDSKLEDQKSVIVDSSTRKSAENKNNLQLDEVVKEIDYNLKEAGVSEQNDHMVNISEQAKVNDEQDEAMDDDDNHEELASEDQIEASDQDQAQASQEIEVSDQEGTEAEQELEEDEEQEVEPEQSQEEEGEPQQNHEEEENEMDESKNQEEIEASQEQVLENDDEIDAEDQDASQAVEEEQDEENDPQDEEAEVEVEASDDEDHASEDETNDDENNAQDEEEEIEIPASDDEVQASDDEAQASDDGVQNESQELEEEVQNDIEDENDDEQHDDEEMVDENEQNESQEEEDEIEESDNQEMEVDNSEEVQEDDEGDIEQHETEPQQSEEEIEGNVTHDTTGKHRKKRETNTPEAILHNASNEMDSFTTKGRDTSIRKTKSILKNFTIRPSMAPPRESTGLSDGTKNSSAEGSGWDSHRTTRKTLRQTFGKDFTPRKSLRALVMEKSAARRTTQLLANPESRLHQANSTELPDEHGMDVQYEHNVEPESDHEVSRRIRQTNLEMYLQKVKKENMEMKQKIEQQVKNSLNSNPVRVDILNFRSNKPAIRRGIAKSSIQTAPKSKRVKSSVINLENLPPEIVEDMKYKPPKRFKPSNASWITKRLYKFLETKLEPKYDYKARVRAEKLVETLYNFVRDIKRVRVAPPHSVMELKKEMARLNIVSTHFEFYHFFSDYLPMEVKIKVVPDIVNNIPLPREGVFAAIIE